MREKGYTKLEAALAGVYMRSTPQAPLKSLMQSWRTGGCLIHAHRAAVHRDAGGLARGLAGWPSWFGGQQQASGGASCANLSGPPVCCTAVRRAPNALWTQPNSIRLSSHDPTRLWRESHGRALIVSHGRPTRTIARDGGIYLVSRSPSRSFGPLRKKAEKGCLPVDRLFS